MKKISKFIFVLLCLTLTGCDSNQVITHSQESSPLPLNIGLTQSAQIDKSTSAEEAKITDEIKKLTGKSFIQYTQNYRSFFAFYGHRDDLITIHSVKVESSRF